MATRPVFVPNYSEDALVDVLNVNFQYFSGLAVSQKRKSIDSLHGAIKQDLKLEKILEISSKSEDILGTYLSAFNLQLKEKNTNRAYSVECAYQGSKVFDNGGPYTDLFNCTSREAKKDTRLIDSGNLKCFQFFNTTWDIQTGTAFYDWLYINALNSNTQYHEDIEKFDAFTDIEFNPKKSKSCQAFSVAMFLSLRHKGLLNQIKKPADFLEIYKKYVLKNEVGNSKLSEQISLI